MPSSSSNINNTFFEGLYKHAWKGIIPAGLTEAEVDFIQEIAALNKDKKVLDIMCGYGRHSLELARRGVQVTSIDNLQEYIQEIKTKAAEQNLSVDAQQADVLHARLTYTYDAVICMGNSFAFFDKADAVTILKNISNHLKTGGVLIINSWMIAEIAIKYFKEKDWHYAGDYKCVLEYKYCFYPSRIESEQTIIAPDGSVETVKGIDYIFTLDELEEMFNEARLKTKDLYSTPRKRKFTLGDGRIYIVATKMAE
jgi:cyclopropane fatty-acyl-phospholipid synthase-like methyltransferase